MTHVETQKDNEEKKVKQYYHNKHLGSAQFITDANGEKYEHIEYTPYGELWIEETAPGVDKLPFRFTGKELDEETGLYYYGARYLDPKYSRWLSGDPALNDYIPVAPINDQAREHNENLPGMGGVFNTVNLHVYHYAGNNPVKYIDPTGESIAGKILGWGCILGAGIVAVADVASTATGQIYITPGAAALSKSLFLTGTSILALDTANDIATANSQKAPSVLGNRLSVSVSSPNPIPPDDDKDKKDRQRTSPNQMNQQVKKGKAPKSVDRVDSANTNVKGDIVGGTLSVVSTVIGVGSAGLNIKLDIDIADATKRRELVPRSMRIDQTCKIIRAEKSKNIVAGGNLMLKGTGAIHEMAATSSEAEDNKTPSAPLLIYKKEILMEKGMILCE